MPIELDAELQAVLACQKGNAGPLMELLAPLKRPLLSLFVSRAVAGKKPFHLSRVFLIGSHVEFLLRQRPGEKKVIEGELALHYKCNASYVRRCHERLLKDQKPFEDAMAWVRSLHQS